MQARDGGAGAGRVRIRLFGPDGELKDARYLRNLLTNAGLAWQAGRWAANASIPNPVSHIAVGADNTAPAAAQSALGSELARQALDAAPVVKTTYVANDTWTFKATLGPGTGTGALVEAGLFNAAAAGTMVARLTFAVVNKGAGDTMTIEWDLYQTRL